MRKIAALTLALLALPVAAAAGSPAFYPVAVYVDAGERALAAYQVEIAFDPGTLAVVGIEGGDGPFGEAPYYDPAGMKGGRIVVAAFTTAPAPPRGRVRVATLHVMDEEGRFSLPAAHLAVAAGPGGEAFDASLELTIFRGDDQ